MSKKNLALLKPNSDLVTQSVHSAFDDLPQKKQTFIKELHKNGWNKTQAGLKAGLKNPSAALQTANNWLKEPKVQRAIEEFQALDNKAINLCVDDLKAELWKNHLRATRVSDSNKSLELILRILGAFKDNLEVTQAVGLAQVLEDLTSVTRAVGLEEDTNTVDQTISKFETTDKVNPDKEQLSSDNETDPIQGEVFDKGE